MSNSSSNILMIGLMLAHAALLMACTGGGLSDTDSPATRSSGNRPPVVTSAKILDAPLSLAGPATVQIQSEDPEREPVTHQYEWYVDDALVPGQTGPTLSPEYFRRGQRVSVVITSSDSLQKGQPYQTASVVVGNTSPRVSTVSMAPQTARPGDRLETQVEASDSDHDRIDLSFKWYRNDMLVKEGDEPFLDTTGFATRDKIVVEATAHDPAGTGGSLKSEPLVLGNSGPTIVSTPPASASTSQDYFDYLVKAKDPDGDRLTYQLEVAPAGMTISEELGHITWQIPADLQGTFHVKVVAKDGQGGIALQEFDLTLTAAAHARPLGG
jgi:hypothetical protein